MDMLENHLQVDDAYSTSQSVFLALPSFRFNPQQIGLIRQSKEAYDTSNIDASALERAERTQEGLIVLAVVLDVYYSRL